MSDKLDTDSDGPMIDDNIIRIQLRKSCQRKWELRTRNHSPGVRFPTIQLFDCEGNLLVETNDENISIKSCDYDESNLRTSQSLREKDYKHFIDKKPLRKHNTISGGKIYTRIYRTPLKISNNVENAQKSYVIRDSSSITNIPNQLTVNIISTFQTNSLDTTPFQSDELSEGSSYKSSDNETCEDDKQVFSKNLEIPVNNGVTKSSDNETESPSSLSEPEHVNESLSNKVNEVDLGLHKSRSLTDAALGITKGLKSDTLARSRSGACVYDPPHNKVPFLSTYLKSLPRRTSSNPDWFGLRRKKIKNIQNLRLAAKRQELPKLSPEKAWRCRKEDNASDMEFINIATDVAADCEMKKRLKMYRRGLSEVEHRESKLSVSKRRHSVSDVMNFENTSSSESVDEADLVLSRLKRRILKNKFREKRQANGAKYLFNKCPCPRRSSDQSPSEGGRNAGGGAPLRSRHAMGSNISQHSAKGLKGRRARSSGDLCNGDSKSNTESSVCGSVVGDVMGWNRSLPNHLDGNRHLADYSRVNNNYAEFSTYRHPKGGRGLRYRVSKSGSDAEPVWKLQDPGFDQGYASERSPEDDYVAPIVPQAVSLEEYEADLRAIYPFITQDNTFTVLVEKDGRGLGMSVCGGAGLVRIRRLYPPQPAWRTGRLAPRDLLLAANNVPLAGLTTYEALEVLRTAPPRVELRVCRPPPDVLESVTPPDPPTPPVRTPHPPHHLPPPDPLNCHPMHQRLSQTTSSATTSSSEGRGRREHSPEPDRRGLHLPDLDQPLPVYDVRYGEFDIVMTKVNGSLGFTLRKEDHSALGHYVRALVREPALSDGRIQPGDRIVAVNDTSMSNMSHADAVAFLRACGAEVRLRLYRDHAATPLSPMSPKEEPTDSDGPANRPKPPLRAEALTMLCDLAARRLTPDTVDGSRSPCLSPRKFRRLTKENNHYETPHVPPHGYELNNLDNATLDAPNYQEDRSRQRYIEPTFPADSDEPVSMPAELSSDEARFKHANPAYQSAVLHTSSAISEATSDGYKDDGNGLKKWKGVALSPDNERKVKIQAPPPPPPPPAPPMLPKPKEVEPVQKENVKPETSQENCSEPTIVTVELNRGWNSRLGFSVQSHPESGQSYISAVYSDSVAARDGRLRKGDVILQVNDENVTSMKTPEVIDLLRILRGSICITVLRPPNNSGAQ